MSRILITGAARRLGRMIALGMASAGWDIVVHCNGSRADAGLLAEQVRGMGRKADIVQADLADAVEVGAAVARASEAGPLAALVNNAGLFEKDESDPDGTRHWAVNLVAPRVLSEHFARLADRDAATKPCIVNILDSAPTRPEFKSYNRSKIELEALTLDMARRLAPEVRVNGVALGIVMQGIRQSDAHFNAMQAATPLGGPIPPEAVVNAVRFLIETPAITGDIIHVDGGRHLK